MTKKTTDPHKKRQKQIRMTDELRARFDQAVKDSGLKTDEYLELLLDSQQRKNATDWPKELRRLAKELEKNGGESK